MQLPFTDPDRPVLIAGPTASGKSALALDLAARQGGVIINADALQVFERWRILTARPSDADEAAAPHALYGHIGLNDDYSVGHWLREVAPFLTGGKRPIIVGGTGLYFTALTNGLAEIPATPPELRTQANARRAAEGHGGMLAELDAASAARIDRQNPMRVQRAWEVLQATGRGIAAWQDDTPPPLLPLGDAQAFVLMPDRDWLNERIERRFGMMMDEGALDEARAILPDWDPGALSARAIGAPELIAHLQGDMDLTTAIDAAVTATRQFAKRQRTWFRARMRDWTPISLG